MDERLRDGAERELGRLSTRDLLQALTRGRRAIFVIMSYDDRGDTYAHITSVAESGSGVACLQADDLKSSGHDLLEKIHLLIRRSEFAIAEISKRSPNVHCEVGHTVAVHERPLLLIEKPGKVPAELRGLETVEYRRSSEGLQKLETDLAAHVSVRLDCGTGVLRDMLEAPEPYPAFIVASPKYPTASSRVRGQILDTRTSGL